MTIKDLARLDPRTVRLWNGERWTCLLGISRLPRVGTELEIVLRSGERIACTPMHRFPTDRGLLAAADIRTGDVMRRTILPEPTDPRDCVLDEDAAWFAGMYIAEGSRAGDTIQIAGHAHETQRLGHLRRIATKYGGSLAVTVRGNNQAVRMYGKVLVAILAELVSGKTAHDKGFAPVVWRYSNRFIAAIVDGYLSGDGHYDAANDRWRLGFCRNYNLERDLRTACARLGYRLVLNLSAVVYKGRSVPIFRGELRKTAPNGHHNEKPLGLVVEVRRARCRNVYDLGVEDDPHLFALASGVLTHNSKPNPMPESVTDRPTKAHEYIFLMSKSKQYYYDAEAVREDSTTIEPDKLKFGPRPDKGYPNGMADRRRSKKPDGWATHEGGHGSFHRDGREAGARVLIPTGRNRRTVWTIATQPFPEAHFATFPEKLIEPCIRAGTSEKGYCSKCGKPWARVVESVQVGKSDYHGKHFLSHPQAAGRRMLAGVKAAREAGGDHDNPFPAKRTLGFRPTCACSRGDTLPGLVLDPFMGSGTTALVAKKLCRDYLGIELNQEYVDMAKRRLREEIGLFA